MLLISLDWERPVDGVEIVKADAVMPRLLTDGLLIRGKTKRTAPLSLRVANLENPVAVDLANARSHDQLCDFVVRYGQLGALVYNVDRLAVFVDELEGVRDEIEEGIALLNKEDDAARVAWSERRLQSATLHPALEYSADDGRQRLGLRAAGLSDLMVCEIAFAMEAGARSARCENCGNVFLTGPSTGRRSTATYCADRCRTAAMRVRNASRGEK